MDHSTNDPNHAADWARSHADRLHNNLSDRIYELEKRIKALEEFQVRQQRHNVTSRRPKRYK